MSKSGGQIIGGGIGAVIGYIYGGPQGAQLGWTIGSYVGGYIDPAKNYGPRLQDAAQQTAIDGVPITFGYGTYPTTGNIIWRSPLREVKKKQRAAKGGTAVNITYEYYRSYAIGVCEGPITGWLQVKRNGKIVYDARPDADLLALGYTADQVKKIRVAQAKFLSNITLYLGDESQMPDPTIESHEGVGNVAAFRGLAYMVVEEENVTAMDGAIPQYEFVVSHCGTTGISGDASPAAWLMTAGFTNSGELKSSTNGQDWSQPATRIDFGEGLFWYPSTSTKFSRSGVEVLAHTGASDYGPRCMYSADGGANWVPVFVSGADFTGRKAAKVGLYWYIAKGISSNVDRWDGSVLSTATFVATAVAEFETNLYTARSFSNTLVNRGPSGAGLDGATFTPSPTSVVVVWLEPLASVLAVFWRDPLGAMNIASTSDGIHFEHHVSPFAPEVGDSNLLFSWNRNNGRIVATYGSQVAYGTSLDDLTLSSHVFASTPYDIGNDGTQFIVCGANRLLERTTDGNTYTPLTAPTNTISSTGLVGIVSLGDGTVPDGYTPIPDAPGWYIGPTGDIYGPGSEFVDRCRPFVATAVADLCIRAGLQSDEYDVSDLTDQMDGYRVHGEAGADNMLGPLSQAFFFDSTEFDGKVRFIKRGGDPILSIGPADFVEQDGDAVQIERVQEVELLRKQTVAAFTPESGFARSTQEAERRSATVEAAGESLVEVPIVCTKDELAQIADKRIKIPYSEPDRHKFALPYRLSSVTPADILELYDDDGNHRSVRVEDVQVDSGIHYIETIVTRKSAYSSEAIGALPPPPLVVDPPINGPTVAAILNIPVQAETDDELGVYIAVAGVFSGWQGATVDYSTDGGANYSEAATITDPATIGTTLTSLLAEYSSEYLGDQSLDVRLPDPPESVDYLALLRTFNRAAVQNVDGSWEVLQYQTATTLGDGQYRLSGLVRGRYATTPGPVQAGATFVLLDSAVKFVQVPTFILGSDVLVRATTTGTSSDAAVPQTVDFSVGASQTEWPPGYVRAKRNDDDDVSVEWLGRGRLSTDLTPRHSKYFVGYAVEVDDGSSVAVTQTTEQSLVLQAAPSTITVRVAGVNSITGIGPYSEAVTV